MSVKKLLILSAAGVAAISATAALAGGPDMMAMPAAPAFQPKVYVDGHLGYAAIDWRRFSTGPFVNGARGNNGGFTGGADLGYQFTRNLGVEIGAFYLPEVRGTSFINGLSLRVSSWFAYIAGKLTVPLPIYHDIDVFGKVGAAYRQLRYSGPGTTGTIGNTTISFGRNSNYWTPMFAVGGEYQINENWAAGIQYMRVPGHLNATPLNRRAPAANLFTGFASYQFAV